MQIQRWERDKRIHESFTQMFSGCMIAGIEILLSRYRLIKNVGNPREFDSSWNITTLELVAAQTPRNTLWKFQKYFFSLLGLLIEIALITTIRPTDVTFVQSWATGSTEILARLLLLVLSPERFLQTHLPLYMPDIEWYWYSSILRTVKTDIVLIICYTNSGSLGIRAKSCIMATQRAFWC